jgi:hypothetical protein
MTTTKSTKSTNDIRSFTITPPQGKLNKIKCYESFDVDDLKVLISSDVLRKVDKKEKPCCFFEHEKDQLTTISKNMKGSKSSVKNNSVSYYFTKNYEMGRVYAFKSLSLGSLRKAVRHSLAGNKYFDIDVDNCHPAILTQISMSEGHQCKYLNAYVTQREEALKEIMETYNVTRDKAKNLIIRICYGGSISSWMNENSIGNEVGILDWVEFIQDELKSMADTVCERNPQLMELCMNKSNPKRSALSIFAQDKERCVLEAMFEFMVKNKYVKKSRRGEYGAVLCFDGIMIPQENVNVPVDELLTTLRTFVFEKTSLQLGYSEKVMNNGYNLNELRLIQEAKQDDETITIMGKEFPAAWALETVEDDREASIKVNTLYPYWKYNTKTDELFVFDDETGMWSSSHIVHKKVISTLSDFLHQSNASEERSKKSYGNTTRLMTCVFDFLKTECIDDNWLNLYESSSLGYLLFKNGYLDMKTMKFYSKEQYGFDPEIVFFGRINRPFAPSIPEDIAEMEQKLFYNVLGREQGEYIITFFARALAGDIQMKKFFMGVGVGNSGKGTITKALQYALDDLVGSFNAGSLCVSKSSNDKAAMNRWIMLLARKRIIIGNEISNEVPIDSSIIKMLSSGGDRVEARFHGGNETAFTPHFTMAVFVNDLPQIKPYDQAVDNRAIIGSFDKSYVDCPQNEFELQKDEGFCQSLSTDKVRNVVVNMLLKSYYKFMEGGEVMVTPQSILDAKKEWVTQSRDIVDTFLECFDLTDNADDFVANSEIEAWLVSNKTGYSIHKFNKAMKRYIALHPEYESVENKVKKIKGSSIKGYIGLKIHYECMVE